MLTVLHWPDGSPLLRAMVLPGRGVVPVVRIPVKVTGWLTAGVVVVAVMVRVVAVRVPTLTAAVA